MIYIIPLLLGLLSVFSIFLYALQLKISKLEIKILSLFREKTDLIPSLFEVSRGYITKHDEIFKEIVRLRKVNFTEHNFEKSLAHSMHTQEHIHNELNFIFKICNKHQKLLQEGDFIYLRDIIIEKSFQISESLELYKKITAQYNAIIKWKKISIIGLFIPLGYIQGIS